MKLQRRTLLELAAGTALVAPRAVFAQALPGKSYRIGYMSHTVAIGPGEEALRQGLRELGYVEGRNLTIEWRFTNGRLDLHPEMAAELLRLNVDCIVTRGIAPTLAAKRASATVPIVMANASDDPVRHGLVASLARPGGNVTGLVDIAHDLAGKRMQLLKETVPKASRFAILWPPEAPAAGTQFKESEAAARLLGLSLQSLEVRSPSDIEAAFRSAATGRAEALIVISFGVISNHAARIAALASEQGLPSMSALPEGVAAGGLMGYFPSHTAQYRRAAAFVDKILRGAKPADLPVEQPTRFDLVVNMKTAKALALKIPATVLLQATEVIE